MENRKTESLVQHTVCIVIALICLFTIMVSPAYGSEPKEWENKLRESLQDMETTLKTSLKKWQVPDQTFRVSDYGAIGDGNVVNTIHIQKAIDACSKAGGGIVLVDKGEYVTGTLDMKSGVMLEVSEGAKLIGSLDLADYPDRITKRPTVMDSNMNLTQSLIYAERCERIGIRGKGEINGRGTHENFPGKVSNHQLPGRPFLIRMVECNQIVLEGITLRTAAAWMQNYLACKDIIIDGITVENLDNWNTDAVDIDGCRNVIVRNCFMNSQDDGLCFKGASLRDLENVLVEDCTFFSTCNAIKFGTDSQGDFRRVLIRNCTIGGPPAEVRSRHRRLGISGISLQSVDGGTLEDILITDIQMDRTLSPFCLRLGHRGRVMPGMKKPGPGEIRNVVLENIHGGHHGIRGSIISGIPGAHVEDIVFRNIDLTVSGGGSKRDAVRQMPELTDAYPDAFSFGKTVPAYGFWIRHSSRISFDEVSVTPEHPDARAAILIDEDVEDILFY